MVSWFRSLLDRIMGRRTPSATQPIQPSGGIKTAPLSDVQLAQVTKATLKLEPPQFMTATALSVGRQREHNEDSLLSFNALLAGEKVLNFGIFMVADGLGGHAHGDIASQTAVRVMSDHLLKGYYLPIFSPASETPIQSLQEMMETSVAEAHRAVKREASGGGTTLTALLILGRQLTLAHIGDSRAYLLQPNEPLKLLTRDHSFARRLEELGQLSPEEVEAHPKRHDLYRALGLEVSSEADIATMTLPEGGTLLVCSDGLWGVVPDAEMQKIISSASDLKSACLDLVQAANAAGGPDNISVILVGLPN